MLKLFVSLSDIETCSSGLIDLVCASKGSNSDMWHPEGIGGQIKISSDEMAL